MKLYTSINLFNQVPPQIFSILSLKQLDLSQNGLCSIRGIGSLVNITDLDLSGNLLEFLPDEICNLTALTFANFSKNYLTNRSIPQGFFEKPLNSVDLSENLLVKVPPELLQCLIKSESVSIHSNPWENADLAKITADSTEESIKEVLHSLIPAVPPRRLSVHRDDLRKSPSSQKEFADAEIVKAAPPTSAKPPTVRPRGEASAAKDDVLSPSLLSPKPFGDSPTVEMKEDSVSKKSSPKQNEKESDDDHFLSIKRPVSKSKSDLVLGSKEKVQVALDASNPPVVTVSDLSKKIGLSIPTKPRSESNAAFSALDTPKDEPKLEVFPVVAADSSDARPSTGGIGSMFKNFSSKMRGNTNAPKPAAMESSVLPQAPERTAAPLKAMTRASGPKGRKAATIDVSGNI
jgi:hypothetical protein